MNELNDVLEFAIIDIENLQGTLSVLEAAFNKDGAFSEMSPQDVAATFAVLKMNLDGIHAKVNKALEWAAFTQYHGEGSNA